MFFFLRVYLYWISVLLCFVVVFFFKNRKGVNRMEEGGIFIGIWQIGRGMLITGNKEIIGKTLQKMEFTPFSPYSYLRKVSQQIFYLHNQMYS